MPTPLSREAGRALRATWLNTSGRWHARRAMRHQQLRDRHRAALAGRTAAARKMLAAR